MLMNMASGIAQWRLATHTTSGGPRGASHLQLQPRPGAFKAERVADAQRLLSQCLPYEVIVRKLEEKHLISRAAAQVCVAKARAEWQRRPVQALEEERTEMVNQLQMFFQQCMAKGDHGPAIRALDRMAVVKGLYPDQRRGNGFSASSEEDGASIAETNPELVRARIADLIKKHGSGVLLEGANPNVPKVKA